jgi:hypothetical protein
MACQRRGGESELEYGRSYFTAPSSAEHPRVQTVKASTEDIADPFSRPGLLMRALGVSANDPSRQKAGRAVRTVDDVARPRARKLTRTFLMHVARSAFHIPWQRIPPVTTALPPPGPRVQTVKASAEDIAVFMAS